MIEQIAKQGRNYCRCCGSIIAQEKDKKRKLFCSDQCRVRWWSLHRDESKHRDPHEIVCAACGETFVVTKGNRSRKYCCHEHYIAAQWGQEILPGPKKVSEIPLAIEEIEKEAPDPLFEETCQMVSCEVDESIPMFTVRAAREGEKLNPKRVFLLTGRSKFQGKYDHFVSLIPSGAEGALLNGDVFVFCNGQRTQLSVLQWQGDGFALFFKRTEFNQYPWPLTLERKLIEISVADLRLLLEIPGLTRRLYGIPAE